MIIESVKGNEIHSFEVKAKDERKVVLLLGHCKIKITTLESGNIRVSRETFKILLYLLSNDVEF